MWWTAQLVVRALYDFDRRQDDDIDFRKGDRMVVVNKTYVRQLTASIICAALSILDSGRSQPGVSPPGCATS